MNNLTAASDMLSVLTHYVAKNTDRECYFHARRFFHQRAAHAFGLQRTRVCYMFICEVDLSVSMKDLEAL